MATTTEQMTSKERILAAIRHQPHDRVPVCPRINPRCVAQIGLTTTRELVDQLDPCWYVSIGTDLDFFAGKGARDGLSTSHRNGTTHTILKTPLGDLERVQRPDRERGTTWGIKDFLEDKGDIEKFKSIPYQPAEPDLDDYLGASLLAGGQALVQASIPSAINLPAGWMAPMTFNLYSVEERDLILDLIELVNERIVRFVSRAAEMGVRYFWMYGPEYAGPPLMHPRCYEIFAKPFDRKIVEAAHAHGAILHTHMHGKVRKVLDSLVESGTDVVSPLEAPPMGEIDLAEVLPIYGKRVCLMGNLDDYSVIDSGDLGLIRKRAEAAITARNESGGDLLLGGTDDAVRTPRMAAAFMEMGRIARELSVPR